MYDSVSEVVGRRISEGDSLLSRAIVAERPATPETRFCECVSIEVEYMIRHGDVPPK